MPCYKPLQGWRSRVTNANGKTYIVFSVQDGHPDLPVTVKCGRCIGCKLDKSRDWAVRCMHEAQMNEENAFLTLTYKEENLPDYGSLRKADFPEFIAKLRRYVAPLKLKYYQCGEYGEEERRPHHHAILFGYDFKDKVPHSEREGLVLYTSATLESLWGHGNTKIGEVTYKSAAYVARYIMKKVTGEPAWDHYTVISTSTGELFQIEPEYQTMSNRPGIGSAWFEQYISDIYPDDFCVIEGKKVPVPNYYKNKYALLNEKQLKRIKAIKRKAAKRHQKDNTPARLKDRETVMQAKLSQLKRGLESKQIESKEIESTTDRKYIKLIND